MFFSNDKKEQEEKERTEGVAEQEVTQEAEKKEDAPATEQGCCDATIADELTIVKDKLVRLGADFQNYKKRTEKEQEQWAFSIQSQLFKELFTVVDDFDRALQEAEKEGVSEELAQWLAGFELIHKGLYEFLKKQQVAEITDNKTFNPELHEALMQVESESHDSGEVVQVLQKGFMLRDRVIRPAKVSVAK